MTQSMVLDRTKVAEIIKDKLNITTNNCGPCDVYSKNHNGKKINTIGIFDNICEQISEEFKHVGGDYYFIPGDGKSILLPGKLRNYKLFGGRLQILVLPAKIIDNCKETRIEEINVGNGITKYTFKLSDAIKLWDEEDNQMAESIENFEDKSELSGNYLATKLTARDRICVDLLLPVSSSKWINDLIIKHIKTYR